MRWINHDHLPSTIVLVRQGALSGVLYLTCLPSLIVPLFFLTMPFPPYFLLLVVLSSLRSEPSTVVPLRASVLSGVLYWGPLLSVADAEHFAEPELNIVFNCSTNLTELSQAFCTSLTWLIIVLDNVLCLLLLMCNIFCYLSLVLQ